MNQMESNHIEEPMALVIKKEQNEKINKATNSRYGLSVYGYIRQNFHKKCLIQGIIATIIQFFMDKSGFLFVCGEGGDGRLGIKEFYNWECMEPTRVQAMNKIIDISAGNYHTMMVDCGGSIWACGEGKYGKLGSENAENIKVPRQVELNHRAVAVSVGCEHSMILVESGAVLSCGRSDVGQLGHGDSESQSVPKIIAALKEYRVTQISAGYMHNGALSENGDLFMWGNNSFGQCGVGKNKGWKIYTPTVVKLKEKVSVIDCGNYHSLLTTVNNLLYSFGSGSYGELGHGTVGFLPTLVELLNDVKIITAAGGFDHTLCVDDHFNVWAFGSNEVGQCGHSKNIKCQPIPKKIEFFSANNTKARAVAAGTQSSCVITQNNECFVFGNNDYYQLGLELPTAYPIPTKLPLFVQKASMGYLYSTFIGEQQKE